MRSCSRRISVSWFLLALDARQAGGGSEQWHCGDSRSRRNREARSISRCGFSPEYPEMRASFFAVGAGIAHQRDLGVIDMRQIAPTVAKILGVAMPTAKATPLNVKP
jgi:hypothetical protein